MTLLEKLKTCLTPLNIPFETGIFSDKAPDTYMVIVPMNDTYEVHADNKPLIDVEEARLSIFTKGSYTAVKGSVVRALLLADITITARNYIGFETETGYHHYNVDVADYLETED